MATYQELAPIISGTGITRAAVETYFENLPQPPEPTPDPVITAPKIQALANIYFTPHGIENANGLAKVARTVGLTEAQCKAIIKEIETLYGVWVEMQGS